MSARKYATGSAYSIKNYQSPVFATNLCRKKGIISSAVFVRMNVDSLLGQKQFSFSAITLARPSCYMQASARIGFIGVWPKEVMDNVVRSQTRTPPAYTTGPRACFRMPQAQMVDTHTDCPQSLPQPKLGFIGSPTVALMWGLFLKFNFWSVISLARDL